MKLLLTKTEVSETLSLSLSTIERMTRDGSLPAPQRVGNRVLWRYSDLKEWTDKMGNNPQQERRGRKRVAV